MNSQATRKVKASSARTTRFMPARKAGVEGQHAAGCFLVLAVADGKEARRRSSEVGDSEKKCGERVHTKVRTDPRQAERSVAATMAR